MFNKVKWFIQIYFSIIGLYTAYNKEWSDYVEAHLDSATLNLINLDQIPKTYIP